MKITFSVIGVPAPGGSKNAFPFKRADGTLGVRVTDAGKGNAEWKKVVAWTAKSLQGLGKPLHGIPLLSCPLRLSIEFIMPRGKTVKRRFHTIAPDLSKLLRAAEDAMTGIVWIDDAQIVEHGPMRKRYAEAGEYTGARITVETLDEIEQALPLKEAKAPASVIAQKPETIDSPFD